MVVSQVYLVAPWQPLGLPGTQVVVSAYYCDSSVLTMYIYTTSKQKCNLMRPNVHSLPLSKTNIHLLENTYLLEIFERLFRFVRFLLDIQP